MSMPLVNHFKIKRQAHALSRAETGINPFAHIGWQSPRSKTFPADVERGPDGDRGRTAGSSSGAGADRNRDSTGPLYTADSAPQPGTRGGVNGDVDGKVAEGAGATADTSSPDGVGGADAGGSALSEMQNGQRKLDGGLRNRRPEPPPLLTSNGDHKDISSGSGSAPGTADAASAAAATQQDDGGDGKNKKKGSKFFKHIEPKEPFTVANQIQRTFLNSWINVLLVAAPAGIALHFVNVSPIAVFVVNFVAIIPLAAMLSFATEEIALRTGETLGGLLNASFGNAVELIVAVIALMDRQVVIVQTSLIGSILSNLLLVLGMCFFFGGLRRQEQFFNTTVAQTAASLLALAVAGAIVPTVFDKTTNTPDIDVAMLSRGTAVILLVVYAAYLYFQLHTHHTVFNEPSQKVPAKPFRSGSGSGSHGIGLHYPFGHGSGSDVANNQNGHHHNLQNPGKHGISEGLVDPARRLVATGISPVTQEGKEQLARMLLHSPARSPREPGRNEKDEAGSGVGEEEEDEDEEPQLHFMVAVALLAGSTVIIAFCAEFLVDSIDYVTSQGGISKEFLGLILLPIVGNAAEHATAVTVAVKDKMDLAIGVAIGSSMQVSLFLIPLLVIIGWGKGIDNMSLSFDVFQVAVLFVSVLLVNYLIGDGKSHWLEGFLLICLYCIIAVCSWWYPVAGENGAAGSSNSTTQAAVISS